MKKNFLKNLCGKYNKLYLENSSNFKSNWVLKTHFDLKSIYKSTTEIVI